MAEKPGDNRTRILRWLRPLVFPADIVRDPRPAVLRAEHVNVNDRGKAVREWPLEGLDDGALGSLVADADGTLADDAAGLGGPQRYVLTAAGTDDRPYHARLTLRYRGEAEEGADDGLSSEPATTKGLLAQLMRHNEAMMRLAQIQTASAALTQQRMIESLSARVVGAEEKAVELMTLIGELADHKAERDLKARELEAKIERNQTIAKGIVPLLAGLAKKYTGADMPGALTPEQVQIKGLLASLKPEQVQALIASGVLSPDQLGVILDLMEAAEGANGAS